MDEHSTLSAQNTLKLLTTKQHGSEPTQQAKMIKQRR
jgi:hypothetical protein